MVHSMHETTRSHSEADRRLLYVLAVFFELLQRVFRLGVAALRDRQTLEIRHQKVNGRFQFVHVSAFHLLDDEAWKRSFLL